jgi:hypothetical protein
MKQKSLPHGSAKPQEELEVFVRFSLLILALTVPAGAFPQSQVSGPLAGVVFEDRDRDGDRDPGEPGLANVVVCSRSDCSETDADGTYEVQVEPGYQVVWVSLPDGFRANRGFFRRVPADPFEWLVNFPLESSSATTEFRFLHASDTHLDEESLPRFQLLKEIAVAQGVDFVLVTGDLVRDALRVSEETARARYELFRKEKEAFPVPLWVVPGNHEIFGIERHRSGVSEENPLYGKAMYRRFLGPTYYSFNHGGVHFVALDTADVFDRWYYGHVDETQLAWLAEDLAHVPAETPIVTFNHIPLFSAVASAWGYRPDEGETPGSVILVDGKPRFRHVVSNFADVLARLEGRVYPLALGGHFHAREEIVLGDGRFQTRFHQTAAVVAGTGSDYQMEMVSGVTLYRVRNGVIDEGEFIRLDPEPAGR